MADASAHHLTDETWSQILAKRTDEEIVDFAKAKMASNPRKRIGLKYIAPGLLEDPQRITPTARGSPGRKTLTETRAETYAALTGSKPNDRTSSNERDITGDAERIA